MGMQCGLRERRPTDGKNGDGTAGNRESDDAKAQGQGERNRKLSLVQPEKRKWESGNL